MTSTPSPATVWPRRPAPAAGDSPAAAPAAAPAVPTTDTPLVFLDTETDGLHPGRRAWEIAMIRRDPDGTQTEKHLFVAIDLERADPFALKMGGFWDRHPAGRKLSGKDPILGRITHSRHDAASEVMRTTFGTHLVGVNPAFDSEVLARLLRAQGYIEQWHYHLIDLIPMAAGWFASDEATLDLATPPYSSDRMAEACGVEPAAEDERHTALGDARWAMRWYDRLTGPRGAAA